MDALLHDFLMNSSVVISLIVLVASLFTLSKGADWLVDSAVALSLKWGMPKMVIGATIVSLGTTLPEASVSTLAAIKGNAELALGNAIGSIIADTALIIGLAAMLGTVPVDKRLIHRQGTVQFAAALLLTLVSLPFFSPGREGKIYQWTGWIFVVLLACYMYISFRWAKESMEESEQDTAEENQKPLWLLLVWLAVGIAVVVLSSKILIPAVEVSAIKIGIPQSIIAATLVAFGTSVPELVTAITAVRKGHGELAAGNIIGADILNVLFVLGVAAAVTPAGIRVPVDFYYLQFPTMLLVLGIFRFCSTRKRSVITRLQGAFLFIFYVAYIILNFTLRHITG
ncbi:calcium/sodium antiporter [Treponema vincentii]|uniref:calcium/sodium antiporter n=1 Tax=Treponema vincentii TaxID=69710 RepID=UPI003D937E99